MKRALVLSGGGGRGAYQVGVWKALRELNIKYDIITGTSVGALNGALMIQNNFDEVEKFWSNIDFKEVFSDPFFSNKKFTNNKIKVIKKYLNGVFLNKGLEVKALENNLTNNLHEDTFFNSNIDYGTVIYDLKNKKPLMIRKKDIEPNKLNDYIIASATLFPIFKKKLINNTYYVDGGYYDNLPINLAIEMGATEVIAVYIGVFGKRRPVKNKNIKITYIEPKSSLGFPAFFDKSSSQRNMSLGYNDTMKVYGKYEGNIYTFENKELTNLYEKEKGYINEILNNIFKNRSNILIPKKLRKDKFDITLNEFVASIEFIGSLFSIDESKVYRIEEFNNLLIDKYMEFDSLFKSNLIDNLKIKIFNKRKHIIQKIYCELKHIKKNNHKISRISLLYPRTFMSSIYLYLLLKNI